MLIVLAALALLALLVARADAAPTVRTTAAGDGGEVDGAAAGEDLGDEGGALVVDNGGGYSSGPPEALVDLTAAAQAARAAPSLRFAIAAAYRVAGLADDPAPSYARRTRLAALVPWIGLRVGQDDTWQDVVDPTIGHLFVYDVRATWHFDRLVFDTNEIRAHGVEIARRRDRRRLAQLVTRTYYTWLRARAAAAKVPSWGLRADEAAADLDALTEGAWTSKP